MKHSKNAQSVPDRKIRETLKHINDEDGEVNATNMDNQESSVQDNPFRPSELNELRSPVQPVCIRKNNCTQK